MKKREGAPMNLGWLVYLLMTGVKADPTILEDVNRCCALQPPRPLR